MKNRANTLAAILGNMEDLEGAYKDALNAEGSALKENAAYLDSIQGRIDLFNNSVQTMWMNFIDDDVVKFLVNVGTWLIKLVDLVGPLNVALTGLFGGMFAKFKMKENDTNLLDVLFKTVPTKIKNTKFGSTIKEFYDTAIVDSLGTISSTDLLAELANFDDASGSLIDLANIFGDSNMTKEQVKTILDGFDDISDATKEAVLSSNLFTTSQIASATGTNIFTVALAKAKEGVIAFGKSLWAFAGAHPIITGLTAAVIALGAAFLVYDAFTTSHDEYVEKLEEETEALQSVQSELQSVQSELETTKERMDELNAKGTLSFVEEEELNRLRQQTAELERQEKILLAQEQRARKKQINAALNAAKSDPNLRGQNTTTVPYAASQGQGTTYSTPYAAGLQNANTPSLDDTGKNKYEVNLQGLKEAREELAQYEEQLSNIDDAESAEYKNIEEKVESAKKRVEECNTAIDSMHETWQKEYGEVGYIENATEDYEKQWNEKYREHQNYLTQQAFINGDYDKADVLDQYFSNTGTDAAQQFKKEFEDAVKSGKDPTDVIEEMLSNKDYSSAFSGLKEQYGITMDHIGAYFTKVGEFKIDPEFSISKYSKDIKSHSAVISEFQDAITKLGKGTFTMDDYLDLIERFPDLAKGVDISSNAFYGLSRNLNKAIKSRTKDFVRDLQDLRKSMIDAGKSTASIDQLIEAIENMPDDALDDTIERYSTLANEIDKARTAQDKLTASMEENPNQGYETRGEAMDYMKEAMKKGEIGSESNLWNVAKQYGFTSDEEDLNKRADALAKFIAVREKWWKTADDGDDRTNDGYSYEGTENFIESVEKAVKESEEAGTRLSEILTWNYDETTGTFDFDFDNKDLPEIISLLGETEELIGLTTEEWMDLMVQVGQFFNIKWAKADDVIDYITEISEGSEEASTKVDLMTDAVEAYVEKALGKDIDFSSLTEAGIEAITTDEKIRELLRTYLSLKQSIEDPLGLKIDGASLTTVMSSLDKLGIQYGVVRDELDQQIGIDITASDLITTLQEKGWTKEQISSYLQTLTSTENGLGITVNGKANMDKTEVDALLTTVGQIPETETITADIAGTAVGAVAGLKTNLADLTSETHVIDVDVRQTGSLPSIPSNIPSYAAAAGANGTAHVQGTAFNTGSWGAPESETALVGELGPELLVRNGRWTTVGDNGAEFTQVKRGDIIFNHKQTESLLKNGYVTGRGKAYASGNAFASGSGTFSRYEFSGDGGYVKYDVNDKAVDKFGDAASGLSNAADDLSDSTDEFKEVFDWIEVRLEELDETLSLLEAKLENVVYYNEKNNIIDDIIAVNKTKLENLNAGYAEYTDYAAELLTKIPAKYRDAAQNGAIAIEKFVGEADETTLEAINNYREWVQKAADLKQQAEEIITTIRDLAIQKFDNAYESGSVRATVEDSQTEKLQNQVDLLKEMGKIASSVYYGINGGDAANSTGMFENSYKKIEYLTEARKAMQAELNAAVEAGQIKKGSNEWYELIDQMYQIDSQILEATAEIEEFQNAINDIYWENFDQLISRIDYLKDETQNLIDLMDSEDMVVDPVKRKYENGTVEYWTADDVQWSKEGLASLGLYAQQMEIAEYKAKQYAGAIDDLTKEYNAGHYSENEYYEKLNELKDSQYESIEAYYDAQDAIKDLNQTRIDSIKKGIEKEIEAYEELIEKKKEALDADKDMHDFQKSIMEQQKNISDIERKLAALSSDNSLSAAAQRKQLEAELAEARAELEEQYYDRSIEDQQNALDKELENFQKEKDEEVTKMEEYLEDIKQVVADSLTTVQANASGIYDTLIGKATEYDLTLSDSIMSPWQDGSLAVSDYQETFDTAMSSTMDQLEALKNKWQEVIDKMTEAGNTNVANINKENASYISATYTEPTKTTTTSSTTSKQQDVKVGDLIDAGNAKICTDSNGSNPSTQYYSTDPVYAVVDEKNGYVAVRHRSRSSGVSGWFKHSQIRKYAKGTLGVKEDQLALIDELGDELQLVPDGHGRLSYLKKGTSVIPANLTANLMGWGSIDPSEMLERSRPEIGVSPSVINNTTEIHIDASVGELLHVEHLEGNNPAEITKIVDKAWDKHMKELNAHVRRYTNR